MQIVLAVVIIVTFVVTGVLIWHTPSQDNPTPNDDDDPWPDRH